MKKVIASIISILFLLFFNPLFAEDHETSTLDNSAQAQKAENLADAAQEAAQEDIDNAPIRS